MNPLSRRQWLSSLPLAATLPRVSGRAETSPDRKPPLRYLQIGVGHAHASKIGVYEESSDWEVVGIVEEDPELLRKAKEDPLYRDFPFLTLEQGLNTPGLNTVGVETRVKDLLHYTELAVEAGFHVHLDKPAGDSLDHYRRIMEKADRQGLVVQMGYMYRFNPAVQMLHQFLDQGWLGDLFETHSVMSKVLQDKERQQLDDFPGGIMFELGCHVIDLTLSVLGKPDSVMPYPRRSLSSETDTLMDNMLAVFAYPSATATVRSSGLEVEGFSRRHFTVVGTGGTFHIQPLDRPSVRISLDRERTCPQTGRTFPKGNSDHPFEPYRRYVGDAADLASTIRGEQPNAYPSAHDLAVQETVLAASGMFYKK